MRIGAYACKLIGKILRVRALGVVHIYSMTLAISKLFQSFRAITRAFPNTECILANSVDFLDQSDFQELSANDLTVGFEGMKGLGFRGSPSKERHIAVSSRRRIPYIPIAAYSEL